MTTEELLRDTLQRVNDRHSQAGRELHVAVDDVAQAVTSISGGLLRLSLRQLKVTPVFSLYELQTSYRNERGTFLAAYAVPISGFPITVCRSEEDALYCFPPGPQSEQITNTNELREHFRRMATDPGEPLVLDLAFAVRQLAEDKREAETAAAG